MAREQTHIVNTGKPSEQIFEEAMRRQKNAVFRLRDKADLYGLNKKNVAAFGQPSDYIVITKEGAFLSEVKSSNHPTSFPLSCFTRAQRAAMAMCEANNVGHYYLVFIHNMLENKWYISNAKAIIKTVKSGRKSIKWSNLNSCKEI